MSRNIQGRVTSTASNGSSMEYSKTAIERTEVCDSGVGLDSCKSIDEPSFVKDLKDSHYDSISYGSLETDDSCSSKLAELSLSETAYVNSSSCLSAQQRLPHTTNVQTEETPCASSSPNDLLCQLLTQDDDGDTKLHQAIIQPDLEAARWIIAATTFIRPSPLDIQNDKFRQTPLHLAVVTIQPQIVRMLVICGASIDIRDRNGNTPLHLACSRGLLDCVKAMTTPVTETDQMELVRFIHQYRIPCGPLPCVCAPDFSCLDYDGNSYIHLAQKLPVAERMELVNLLVNAGMDINVRDGRGGLSVLHIAVKERDTDFVQQLCQYPGIDVNEETYGRTNALDIAQSLGYDDIVEILQRHGAVHSESFYLSDDQSAGSSDEDQDYKMYEDFDDLTWNGQPLNCPGAAV